MALNHRWQTRHPSGTEGGQVQVLGSFQRNPPDGAAFAPLPSENRRHRGQLSFARGNARSGAAGRKREGSHPHLEAGAECLLVTQRPTCQIAPLYTHWCRMWKGLISTAFLSGSPFPIPALRPAKLVTWQPVIPNVRNPLALPGANSNPTTVRPGAVLG
jgi:hypothetical protein